MLSVTSSQPSKPAGCRDLWPARSLPADVDACIDCDVDMVHVFIPTSDVQRSVIHQKPGSRSEATGEIVAYVRDHLGRCMFGHGCHKDDVIT